MQIVPKFIIVSSKNANMETVFEAVNQVLLIRYPLSIRRIDYSREQINESEDLSEFLRRLQTTAVNANLETCHLTTTILLKYTECLSDNSLNRKIKQYNYKELRKDPNIQSLECTYKPSVFVFIPYSFYLLT